jgi:hypothetical protein
MSGYKKIAIIITPNWRDYAEKYLGECIVSIRKQDYPGEKKVFITDNEFSEESVALIKSLAPEAEIVRNATNDGFAKGVNDSIRSALSQGYDYFAVYNIHTVLEPSCLSESVKVLESDQRIGVAQALMLLPDGTISSVGNKTHYLGFGYCDGYRQKTENRKQKTDNTISYPSGSSMLFRREALEHVGLLDEEYWMYNEDQEIGWRLWLAGWKCVLAPQGVLTNKYEAKRSLARVFWMDRNRINSILICFKWPTLLLILPAFIIMEIGQMLFAWQSGWLKDKLRVYAYFLQPRTWSYIRQARQRNQGLRKVSDRMIARMITGRIEHQEFEDWKLRVVNPIFDIYWRVVRSFIFW